MNHDPFAPTPSASIIETRPGWPGERRSALVRLRRWGRASVFGAIGLIGAAVAAVPPPAQSTGGTPPSVPMPTFRVDTTLKPLHGSTGIEPGALIGSITDAKENQADFLANQLVLLAHTDAEAQALAQRWKGKVDRRFAPHDGAAGPVPGVYVIAIDSTAAKPDLLAADLRRLHPASRGDHRFSSDAAMRTAAVAALEAVAGHVVELNWLMSNHDFRHRVANESSAVTDPAPGGPNSPANAFDWSYLRAGGAQDFAVAEAWRVVDFFGWRSNTVEVTILDSGFRNSADLPAGLASITPAGSANMAGPGTCGSGPCPFHGTAVAAAGFAAPDNRFGVAGPGGPVSRLTLVSSPAALDFSAIVAYLHSLLAGINSADIVVMSFGARIPAAVALTGIDFVADIASGQLRKGGHLLIASAGNEGQDVDAQDCFIVCWEQAIYFPCETNGVLCVGGVDAGSLARHPHSNFGSNPNDCCTVKIWGPYVLDTADVLTGDLTAPTLQFGTSFSAPFVAGIAALVKAADPALKPEDIERILIAAGTPRPTGGGAGFGPAAQAYRAVLRAKGLTNGPPALAVALLAAPGSGAFGPHDTPRVKANAFDIEEPGTIGARVRWTLDGHALAAAGEQVALANPGPGVHALTARVTDSGLLTVQDSINFSVVDHPPRLTIVSPVRPANGRAVEWAPGQALTLQGESSDVDEANGRLADAQVEWSLQSTVVGRAPLALGSGHRRSASLPATLAVGDYTLSFKGWDGNNAGFDSLPVHVRGAGLTPPVIAFQSPLEGAVVRANRVGIDTGPGARSYGIARVRLQAVASDAQDGDLGSRIVWTNALGIEIGRGTQIFADFSSGIVFGSYGQRVTAQVTDSDAQTNVFTLHFSVLWDGNLALPPCETLNQHNCVP